VMHRRKRADDDLFSAVLRIYELHLVARAGTNWYIESARRITYTCGRESSL
jgi:hypothetical protein